MEGSCNEQGRDSLGNDWRTQHEPDLRRNIIFAIVKKLKIRFHQHSENDIKNMTFRFEDKIYGMATDKDDYLQKLRREVLALNQGQSLPTSLPYTQTPTSQQWLPQNNNIQSNLNSPESSSGLPTHVPTTTVSLAQNLNSQMNEEGAASPAKSQSSKTMFQHQMDQQQSLLNQPIQQQLPHHTSLATIEQSSPQSSALSSLPSSGQPNSQIAVPSHEQRQPEHDENLISQLTNGQQNHLTSPQNKGEEEQEQTPRVLSTSQQNNMASFNVNGPSLLGAQGQEVLEEQSQPMMLQQHQPNNHDEQQKPENQPYQLQRTHPANPSSTTSGGDDDWREETYQKIKALEEKYALVLRTLLQKFSDKLREIDSLSQQNMLVGRVERGKSTLEQLLEFLNVCKSSVSEFHRDEFSEYERKVLGFNESYQIQTQRSMQRRLEQQQVSQQPQTNQLPKPMASPDRPISVESPVSNDNQIQTESQEHPPLVTLQREPVSERPIDRLMKAIQSSSPESLAQSVNEMRSVISWTDRFAGSVHSVGGFRALLGEDLSERTRLRVQQGDTNPTKRFKRSVTAVPLDSKVNKTKPSYALLQEIFEINGRLVETVVSICNEDVCQSEVTSGLTVVACSYVPVALSATFKALYNSGHISQIQPLRLLVPENYPYSPILLDKVLFDTASVHKHEDLSERTRSRFGLSIKEYSEPMSLKDIAKVWDECARATMVEYAERHGGGGTFSSKYGHWEAVVRAS